VAPRSGGAYLIYSNGLAVSHPPRSFPGFLGFSALCVSHRILTMWLVKLDPAAPTCRYQLCPARDWHRDGCAVIRAFAGRELAVAHSCTGRMANVTTPAIRSSLHFGFRQRARRRRSLLFLCAATAAKLMQLCSAKHRFKRPAPVQPCVHTGGLSAVGSHTLVRRDLV
jgi:hypothetical protein